MRCAAFAGLCLASLTSFGCAAEPTAEPTSETTATPPAQSAGAEDAAAADPLSGLWVEFWALEGHADTQRYALFPDGRFGWCAAREGQEQGARRWGRWSADGGTLVLTVQGEDAGARCSAATGCRVAHDPPVEQRLPLGQCPPNEEAKSLDASYRCISIGGQAFWRRDQVDDPAAYFPSP